LKCGVAKVNSSSSCLLSSPPKSTRQQIWSRQDEKNIFETKLSLKNVYAKMDFILDSDAKILQQNLAPPHDVKFQA